MNVQAIQSVAALLPTIIATIKAVEEAIPGGGQGRAKLDAVLAILGAAGDTVQQLLPAIAPVVGSLVTLFNATGVFASKKAAS